MAHHHASIPPDSAIVQQEMKKRSALLLHKHAMGSSYDGVSDGLSRRVLEDRVGLLREGLAEHLLAYIKALRPAKAHS